MDTLYDKVSPKKEVEKESTKKLNVRVGIPATLIDSEEELAKLKNNILECYCIYGGILAPDINVIIDLTEDEFYFDADEVTNTKISKETEDLYKKDDEIVVLEKPKLEIKDDDGEKSLDTPTFKLGVISVDEPTSHPALTEYEEQMATLKLYLALMHLDCEQDLYTDLGTTYLTAEEKIFLGKTLFKGKDLKSILEDVIKTL